MTTFTLPKASRLLKPNFTFGVATAAFQIEGAAELREPCIWDAFCERPGTIMDGSNGLVACDHLNRMESDLDLIQSLGVDAYRFSISWPRVMKADGQLNENGLDFYRRLIAGLHKRNIKPVVTLYHWDLPLALEDQGGWLNRETAYRFRDYTDEVTRRLGNSVDSYATLNEPFCSAYLGYEIGMHAPGIADQAAGRNAAHHLLLAHGLGMEVLRTNCPGASNGIVLNLSPVYPASEKTEDVDAAALAENYLFHWYLEPLLTGHYPTDAWNHTPESAQPTIHDGDMNLISQNIDYLGINYYTREVAKYDKEKGFTQLQPSNVEVTQMGWEIYPSGLTDLLVNLKIRYSSLPPIIISENGAAFDDKLVDGKVVDTDRFDYIQAHLSALDNAAEQGVVIDGYFVWSLMDNFEWSFGYQKRFGITYVDYKTQERTLKESGKAFRRFLNTR